jgi:tRNA1(Val) A37 N6-methylase TrmN6
MIETPFSKDPDGDAFLNGRVIARQASGPRAGLDAVMLAAGVTAKENDQVVELGLGAGVASLCLAARIPQLQLVGFELLPEMAELAKANALRNGLSIDVVIGDIAAPPAEFLKIEADHVFANPPFLIEGKDRAPRDGQRIHAYMSMLEIDAWIMLAHRLLKSGGSFTLVHRADALASLLKAFLRSGWGNIRIMPLWPRLNMPAKRVLVRAHKGRHDPLQLLAGLVLHEADGRFTLDAERILRDAQPLSWG